MPDIDVDFCKNKRDEVIRYVSEKYGKDNVAQIITFGTMKSKAAVRDVGRALECLTRKWIRSPNLSFQLTVVSKRPSMTSRRWASFTIPTRR